MKKDVFGSGYGYKNTRGSLKKQMDLIQNKPFVKVAIVRIKGTKEEPTNHNVQTDLDCANEIYQKECGCWIYCVDSITVDIPHLLDLYVLNRGDPENEGKYSDEENELFNLGRNLGANIICYYIYTANEPANASASHPAGKLGFWIACDEIESCPPQVFAHELTHIVGSNAHLFGANDYNNLMFYGAKGEKAVELTTEQCQKIHNDPNMQVCKC